ncbi:protein phosphatase regulator [Exophiala xenobiotica]|uniref:Protein phosphatase regulator n=1 Tax=Vermiconidia calcicola TaxID=1690605 RepID=A0AAV9QMM4_9PEZI|nr:protein phosphatase regulator [Exophiala xenobiotica]KAK5532126.1 protein phosphatase regulator [Chaetothyriales sp. CCFEE 6169]KAK5545375.1 protein phosphatase regulator [Vermiconidia calcicola]KAK5189127.1 protein phosphatase regulator [Exophiala xenobiotica]KAK5213200.1 protein phosphatase regulator [Exophiala xenobiotica]
MTTILQAPLPGASPFSSSPLQSSSYSDVAALNNSLSYGQPPKQRPTYSPHDYARMFPESAPSTAPSSPQLTYTSSSRRDSYASTPASSLSLERDNIDGDDDDDMAFPAFENSTIPHKPYQSPVAQEDVAGQVPGSTVVDVSSLPTHTRDDHAVKPEPTRHVDYLSHEWKEEDIWLSWSYVSHRRTSLANGTRLENASWRSWMKAKNRLKTISPETLNWLKDCDVTWLYGPLQTVGSTTQSTDQISPPPSRLSHSSSFICKKPILKKKSASAAILERSRSQHSLLQRASDIIRIQQSSPAHGRPILRRGNSEFTLPRYPNSSVVTTPAEHDTPGFVGPRSSFALPDLPTPSECKHVLFDEEVRQVQAIDSEDDDKPDETDAASFTDDDDDDGGLMMAPARTSGNASNRATPRGSFSNESKTIVPLPSTTLKCRTDTPEPPEANGQIGPWPTGRKLSPSPSQETLRPSRPSHNFLIDDDPEVNDEPWQPQSSLGGNGSPYDDDDEDDNHPHMRRTESGMFMPYDENDEEAALNHSLFGQAVYAVNTFKDIAHVVWNVGWNRR